ncbi:tyrosine-type recombinase/integrase [Bacillus safensis]
MEWHPILHHLRHIFAINYLTNGSDIRSLQNIMGHALTSLIWKYNSIM